MKWVAITRKYDVRSGGGSVMWKRCVGLNSLSSAELAEACPPCSSPPKPALRLMAGLK